jgi:hypothetical protein
MRGHRRFLALILVAALAFTIPAAANAAVIDKFNDTYPFSFTTPGLCLEPVDTAGMIHVLGSTTFSKGGSFKCSFHYNLQNVTGVGQSSGDDYTLDSTANVSFAGNINKDTNRFHVSFNGTLTDLDTGEFASVTVTVQFTVNANGDVTAQVVNIQAVCAS